MLSPLLKMYSETDFITNCFDMDHNKKIQSMLNTISHNHKDYELELRFGHFDRQLQFHPGITKCVYERLIRFHNNHWPCEQNTYEYLILADNTLYDISKKLIKSKEKIDKLDFHDWNTRLSLAKEKYLSISEKTINKDLSRRRKIDRTSFIINNEIRVDLSRVNDGQGYELEVEVMKKLDVDAFKRYMYYMYQYVQDSFYPITMPHQYKILSSFSELARVDLTKFKGVQPRTMQYEDFGFVSTIPFVITNKLDGKRGLLYVYKNSCILIENGGYDTKMIKIAQLNDDAYDGTVFDVELMGQAHIFDVLFYRGEDLRQRSGFGFASRLELIFEFFKTNASHIEKVVAIKEFQFSTNRESFHRACAIMWHKYGGEGLIIFREDVAYPKSRLDYFFWKWKTVVTFDLLLKGGVLYASDRDILVPFRPEASPNLHLASHESFSQYRDGDIVECRYECGEMVAMRLRDDKRNPNILPVVLDNYYYIDYHISTNLICGKEYYPEESNTTPLPPRKMHYLIDTKTHAAPATPSEFLLNNVLYLIVVPKYVNSGKSKTKEPSPPPAVPAPPAQQPMRTIQDFFKSMRVKKDAVDAAGDVEMQDAVDTMGAMDVEEVETAKSMTSGSVSSVSSETSAIESCNSMLLEGKKLNQWKLVDLKQKCKDKKISSKGSKSVLFERLCTC